MARHIVSNNQSKEKQVVVPFNVAQQEALDQLLGERLEAIAGYIESLAEGLFDRGSQLHQDPLVIGSASVLQSYARELARIGESFQKPL